MKEDKINQYDRMWRTLVRVKRMSRNRLFNDEGVLLIIPARSASRSVFCPKQAIPPAIYKTMKKDGRYHVQCNIGAEDDIDLCFDGWESE
jgi:hypothetical protein